MTNPTDETESIRERQAELVALLDELLTAPLPEIHWHITPFRPSELAGQVSAYSSRTDEEIRAYVKEWADFLKVEVQEERCDMFTEICAQAQFDRCTVKIWSHVERKY